MFAVNPLLVVLSSESAGLPDALQRVLGDGVDFSVIARATPETMLSQAAALGSCEIVAFMQDGVQDLLDALEAGGGVLSSPLSVVSDPLERDVHEKLAALGVHAWMPIESLDAPSFEALLSRARARWARESALRTELDALRTRFDERKWIDRAKGLLMAARGIGEDEAFGLLRGAAMHANLRLGEVSRSVVEASRWADAINRAGQLRMLSQRLVRLSAQALAGIDAKRARVLRTQSTERVQDNFVHLAALELDEAGSHALAEARAAWNALDVALGARIAPPALAEIDGRADALLLAAEALTGALEISGARRALRIVNICGRQRMRAQRLAKDALLASTLSSSASRERLAPTMGEFESALLELEQAPLSSPDIRAALASARDEWLRLVRGVREIDSAEGRAALVRSSDALVETFDQLTASYEHSLQVLMS
ncbi:type IV pili methyl-accepting chemotaxis transducer N-terminal domain-containing protein [Variovorax ureilyticus]|uniref:Type IV pili methyl-accepting chemotaxis transducer N-terminal domain-containing protein n=1 Tax=Variovorax ureilyticus TaxID=1836198 RepID=A0ABU8VG14_9BURK